jgi:serine/threonine-protein kinase
MVTQFGKYALDRKVGEGGMATLHLATVDGPAGFSKRCVVKRIRSDFSRQASFRRMLGQEARVAALLSHPHIVQVFDFGEVDGEYYLTMEWVEGASLARILRYVHGQSVQLSRGAAAAVGLAVADALDYIHHGVAIDGVRTPLVHRDVSPSNVLISTRGAIKLTDFGIVKLLQAPGFTDGGVVKGKYGYMAPEQVKGQELDDRADVFSLGTVLWEMVFGQPAFRRSDEAATIAAVLAGDASRPADPLDSARAPLVPLLTAAVAGPRRHRPTSARALHDQLTRLVPPPEVEQGRRELAQLAALIASVEAVDEPAPSHPSSAPIEFPSVVTRSNTAEVHALSEPAEGGAGLVAWVAAVTAAVVASVLIWMMILR